jgi:hypothetical protein
VTRRNRIFSIICLDLCKKAPSSEVKNQMTVMDAAGFLRRRF